MTDAEITSVLDFFDGIHRLTRTERGSTGASIADLLEDVARQLRALGEVEVHDIVVTPATHMRDESSMTVYYEFAASLVDA
jgi:hypothetical protein